MEITHGFIPTVSTLLILALVVQATPLQTSSNSRLDPRDKVNLSTTIRDHDGVHSIRSNNPFDVSGIFAHVDGVKKVEPQNSPLSLSHIPLAPATFTTLSAVLAEIAGRMKEVEDVVPQRSTATILHRLKDMGEEAIHDKQTLLFIAITRKLSSHHVSRVLNGNLVPETPHLSSDVRNLAQVIGRRLCAEWNLWDEKDIVNVIAYKTRRGAVQTDLTYSSILIPSRSDEAPWDPIRDIGRLPVELQTYLESDIRPMFRVQRILDLGYAFINKAVIHHRVYTQGYERMFIVGYQLMTVAAMLTLTLFEEKTRFRWILYLIRDAEHAERNSDKVEKCLKQFKRGLTELGVEYNVMNVQGESNWEPNKRRNGMQGLSKRRIELEKRAAKRAEAQSALNGRIIYRG
ncbi:hypothetical protein H0H93_010869 [Arthromyces matolae]|nr:hypothetical protein H0H93_010869 [Arthromyces matolae]